MFPRIRQWWRRLVGQDSTTSTPASWFVDWIRGGASDSGIRLDGKKLLTYAPVWYAVNRICGHVGQLPLVLFVREGDRKKSRDRTHPAFRLMKKRPNALMSASVFKELLQYHALLWGNGRAVIVRSYRSDPLELIPLLPDRTKTVLVNGEKWHVSEILVDEQSGRRELRKFRDRDVLHIIGLGYDGLAGYPVWEFAQNSVGLGLSAEKHGNRHFRQFAIPGLVLEAPQGMFRDDTEAKRFLADFREAYEGLDNVGKTAMLREGIKAHQLSHNASDSQWHEMRGFQRQEAALWFLLEHILGDDSSVSYKSLEQKHLAYLTNCLNRWLVKWEEECEEKLLRETEKDRDSHYFKFITAALLRSDTMTTHQTLAIGIRNRFYSPNDARDILDLDEYEGGDEYSNPAITPGSAGTGAENVAAAMRRMAAVRFAELVRIECQRVQSAAERPGGFCDWLDKFYGDGGWADTLTRSLVHWTDAGTAERLAGEFARVSRERLLEAAGRVGPDELGATVGDLVAGWTARAEELAAAAIFRETGG